jgi:chromosome segregation ATPase
LDAELAAARAEVTAVRSECYESCYALRKEIEAAVEYIAKLQAELAAARAEIEGLKQWRDRDPYYLAGKRAMKAAIEKWKEDDDIAAAAIEQRWADKAEENGEPYGTY